MDSSADIEYEPLSLQGNMEVKVPITASRDVISTNPVNENNDDISTLLKASGTHNEVDTDLGFFTEYNRLVDLYRCMSCDMFKLSLLKDSAFCDQMLEQTRSELFEAIKSNEDFPFDPYCEPKRRVFRSKGDTIAIKLAKIKHVHTLIGVTEGEDYSTIRGMISGFTRSKSISNVTIMSTPKSIPKSNIITRLNCNCALELKILKDTVSSLQTNMLLVKQTYYANAQFGSQKMGIVCDNVSSIKKDILNCKREMQERQTAIYFNIESITGEVKSKIESADAKLNDLYDFVHSSGVVKILKRDTHDQQFRLQDATCSASELATNNFQLQNQKSGYEVDAVVIYSTYWCSDTPEIRFGNYELSVHQLFSTIGPETHEARLYRRSDGTFARQGVKSEQITVCMTTRAELDERHYDNFDWPQTSITHEYFVWVFGKK
ncbi:hypothetical protein DPMN_166400 [Dreissena polymorpha]|uniref:Uncharacterized protein n=1 Tax=Dreissena polymorpha TaxID=45954 RepID=A0A9D4F252_DREPO|nr:hypothetical protein DPMN_166400 [Dreissena polymorpha]